MAAGAGVVRTPFEKLWWDLPLRKLVVFGVPVSGSGSSSGSSGGVHHFTVCIYDRMSPPIRLGFKGIHFTLASDVAQDEAQVTSAIARHLAGHEWDHYIIRMEEDEN
jgi:hypothetical protein